MVSCVSYPNQNRNYCVFNKERIEKRIIDGKESIEEIEKSLKNPKSEDEVLENLYALNLLLDEGIDKKEVSELYPVLSKYNDTTSPNIQVFLAGIYRKTKIPDGFGPLVKMLIQDSINPPKNSYFDPTEEIGGAILDYIA